MDILFKMRDGTEETINEADLHKEGPLAHLGVSLNRNDLLNATVLIRQDTRKNPVVRVFCYVSGGSLRTPVFEEVDHYFVNPPGI